MIFSSPRWKMVEREYISEQHSSPTLSSVPIFPLGKSSKNADLMRNGEQGNGSWGSWGRSAGNMGHSRESNFQAMVMPPISESLKRNKKVPSGLLMSRSWACCLFTKPRMALGTWNIQCHYRASISCPQSPWPPKPRAPPFPDSSPVIPMGLVMLLQHLHDPIEPLPEGVVPARQVLLRAPRKPQVRVCGPVITGGPGNSPCPLVLTSTLSQFLALLVSHSSSP